MLLDVSMVFEVCMVAYHCNGGERMLCLGISTLKGRISNTLSYLLSLPLLLMGMELGWERGLGEVSSHNKSSTQNSGCIVCLSC